MVSLMPTSWLKSRRIEGKILEIGPKRGVRAFWVEPVGGSALGCVAAVPGYLKAMQEVCHKHDVLFAVDEVMCGLGRTGVYHT